MCRTGSERVGNWCQAGKQRFDLELREKTMSAKDEYCFRVMRKYGLLVNFDGEPRTSNVPDVVNDGDERLAQWILRVLGPDVENVVVYEPKKMDGKRKLFRFQSRVNAPHLIQVVKAQSKVNNALAAVKTEKVAGRVERAFSTISHDTIQEQLDTIGEALEPSVKEFFQRMIENSEDGLDTEKVIKDLMTRVNTLTKDHRKLTNMPTI